MEMEKEEEEPTTHSCTAAAKLSTTYPNFQFKIAVKIGELEMQVRGNIINICVILIFCRTSLHSHPLNRCNSTIESAISGGESLQD